MKGVIDSKWSRHKKVIKEDNYMSRPDPNTCNSLLILYFTISNCSYISSFAEVRIKKQHSRSVYPFE